MPKHLLGDNINRRVVLGGLVVLGTALFIWQSILLQRSVEDMTTRRYQNIDPRIAEVARTADFVQAQAKYRDAPPLVQFISQGTDADILGYAAYYAIGDGGGEATRLFRTVPEVSWTLGDTENVWQRKTERTALNKAFEKADIIWPVRTAPWLDDVLRAVAKEGNCDGALTDHILIKDDDGNLVCRAKP